jgi:hypothetical protein
MFLKRNDDYSVTLDMTAYSLNIAERYADVFKDYSTKIKDPSDLKLFSNATTTKAEPGTENESRKFKSIVMGLMYLSNVRIDILKECVILSMMANNPTEAAWNTLKRVLRFISKYPSCTINLGAENTNVTVYSDAGYGEHTDGRSHSGLFITLGENGGPILTKSKKQTLVTLSSTEAEMLALTDAVRKALPVARLLVELGFNETEKIVAMQDNTSTMRLALVGEGLGGKAKHFRVRFHFLKELIEEGLLDIIYCSTDMMIADLFTKPMVGKERLRQTVRIMYRGNEREYEEANAEALARVQSNRT